MTIRDLNENYFCLFSDLKKAKSFLPDKQYDVMAKVLQEQYTEELEFVLLENSVNNAEERFRLKSKAGMYIPRRRGLFHFFRWNILAKILRKKYEAEFASYLAWLEKETAVDNVAAKDIQAATEKLKDELQRLPENKSHLPVPADPGALETVTDSDNSTT